MSQTEECGDACCYCDECGVQFRTPFYTISSQKERTEFYDGGRLPEIAVSRSESVATCCSYQCLEKQREKILAAENIRPNYPGIDPTESCGRCGGEVITEQFHRTWVEEVAECQWEPDLGDIRPIEVTTLAVLCSSCDPRQITNK